MFLILPMLLGVKAVQGQTNAPDSDHFAPLAWYTYSESPADHQTSGTNLYGQKINLSLYSTTLEEALNDIARKGQVRLSYDKNQLANLRVTVVRDGVTLIEAFDQVLKGTGLEVLASPRGQVVIKKAEELAKLRELEAQPETISGTVTDASSGETLPGVNILVKGTSTGASTDAEGNYELAVESLQDTLVVSFIGYENQEVPMNDRTEIDVALEPQAISGEEMVVVGYGTQEKVNLTGSVSSIDVDSELEGRAITDATQILAGQSAGVQVRQSTGEPGSDDTVIRIRGIGTLNDASPLIIVDGVESSLSDLNPSNIENISILKDAASASIYGSRAANGVVLITTKTGQKGPPVVRYDGYASVQSPTKIHDMVTNFTDYMHLVNDFYTNSGLPARFDFNDPLVANWEENSQDDWRYANSDHYKTVLRPDWSFNHDLSVSGGGSETTYLASAGYLNNRGIVENAAFERYSGRLNVKTQATDWLTLGANAHGLWSNQDLTDVSAIFGYLTSIPPGFVLRSPDGRYGGNQALTGAGSGANPLVRSNDWNGNDERTKLFSKFYSTIDFSKKLSLESSFAIDFDNRTVRESEKVVPQWDFIDDIITDADDGTIDAENSHERDYRYVIDHLIRYTDSFVDVHNVNVIAGYNRDYSRGDNFSASIDDLIAESTPVLSAGFANPLVDGNTEDRSLQSFFGRINYNYKEKYLFEANLRYDGSSRFAEENRWGTFPSFSAGWRLSEEDFMSNVDFVTNLTLRASWGQLGNNRIGDYEYQSVYGSTNYPIGGSLNAGAAPDAIANPIISWEKTEMLDLGFLLTALDNRLTFEFDVYDKETRDILVNLPLPGVLGGLDAPRQNVGVVSNRGIDIEMGWTQNLGDFSYGIDGNLGYVKNKVLTFDGDNPSHSNQNILLEGHPIWTYYVREVDRMVRTQEDVDWVEQQLAEGNSFAQATPQLGDFVYMDNNNDGVYGNDDDRVITDKTNNPNLVYGFSAFANWKNVDISMLWQGVAGVYAYYSDPSIQTNRRSWAYPERLAGNTWTQETPNAEFPRATWASDNWNAQTSDFWLHNASYLKLKNLQIGYTIPDHLISQIGGQNRIRVYASGENLLTFTGWEGLDPETVRFGRNQRVYPTMRQILFGVNITF